MRARKTSTRRPVRNPGKRTKATAAQQRARREYIRQSGFTFSEAEIREVMAQWKR